MTAVTADPRTPALRPDVVLGPAIRSGESVVHHVKDGRTGWFYRIGPREHFILSRMDGRHTLDEIAADYAEAYDRQLGRQNWAQIFTMLGKRQLLDGATSEEALAALSAAYDARQRADRSLLHRRMPLVRPDAWCAALAARLGWAFTSWFVAAGLAAIVASQAFILTHLGPLAEDMRDTGSLWLSVPVSVAAGWLLVCVHELAHGVTCRYFGGTVTEIGLLWRFPILAPYCRTDDVLLFGRRARVATAFAGVFANLLVLLPVLAWWALSAQHSAWRAAAAGTLLFGSASAIGLLPFLRLDGYHMLGHALNLVDLRAETNRFWGQLLRAARKPARDAVRGYRPADRLAYTLYGLASAGFLIGACGLVGFFWFQRLDRWWGPVPAAAALAGEALLVVAFLTIARRRSAARSGPVGPGSAEVNEHG